MNRLLGLALPSIVLLAACAADAGGEVKVVVSNQDEIGRIVVHRGQIYFTKQGGKSVASARLEGGKITVEAEGIAAALEIAASDDAVVVCAEGGSDEGLRGIVRIDGPALQLLADLPCRSVAIRGQQVYFSHDNPGGLSRVPLQGGATVELATIDGQVVAIDVTETELVAVATGGEVQVLDLDSGVVREYAAEQGAMEEVVSDGRVAYWVSDQGVMAYVADFDGPLLIAEGRFERSSLAISAQDDTTVFAIRINDDPESRTLVAIQRHSREVRDIASADQGVASMVVDQDALYWSEPSTGRLVYLSLPL